MASRVKAVLAWVALATTALGAAALLAWQQHSDRSATIERFFARDPQAASFVTTYTRDVLAREAAVATASLGDPDPTVAFNKAVSAFGFPAAVLLDSSGNALAVWPPKPTVIGTDLSARYAHLAGGVAGRPTVSDQVGAAANGSPVVGFAAPFDTPHGRRVFSGAFAVNATPLGAYFDDLLVTPGAHAYLVDGKGHVLAGNAPARVQVKALGTTDETATLAQVDPALARSTTRSSHGTYDHGGQAEFATSRVTGTTWSVVITAQRDQVLVGGRATTLLPWGFLALLTLTGGLALRASARERRRRRQLGVLNRELDVAANSDPLTGLANPRLATRRLIDADLAGACAVLLIDIDHFKAVNDEHGHATGDQVLAVVADALRGSLRDADTLGRWGGEEFLAILPGASLADADAIAHRALDRVAELTSAATGIPRVTVSIGCAAGEGGGEGYDDLLLHADQALYRAKASGRSAVALSQP